jgi:hypothetical protein
MKNIQNWEKFNESCDQEMILVERFGRDKKIDVIKSSELKDKVKDFIKIYSKIKDIEKDIDDWSDEKLVNKIKLYGDRGKLSTSSEPNKKAYDLYKQIVAKSKDSSNK